MDDAPALRLHSLDDVLVARHEIPQGAPSSIGGMKTLYQRLSDGMGINCGLILDGQAGVQNMGQVIFETILRCAWRQKSKYEELDLGR